MLADVCVEAIFSPLLIIHKQSTIEVYFVFIMEATSTAPALRAEAKAYIEHEFKKGGVLTSTDLYEPTNVSDPSLYAQSGTAPFSFFPSPPNSRLFSTLLFVFLTSFLLSPPFSLLHHFHPQLSLHFCLLTQE